MTLCQGCERPASAALCDICLVVAEEQTAPSLSGGSTPETQTGPAQSDQQGKS